MNIKYRWNLVILICVVVTSFASHAETFPSIPGSNPTNQTPAMDCPTSLMPVVNAGDLRPMKQALDEVDSKGWAAWFMTDDKGSQFSAEYDVAMEALAKGGAIILPPNESHAAEGVEAVLVKTKRLLGKGQFGRVFLVESYTLVFADGVKKTEQVNAVLKMPESTTFFEPLNLNAQGIQHAQQKGVSTQKIYEVSNAPFYLLMEYKKLARAPMQADPEKRIEIDAGILLGVVTEDEDRFPAVELSAEDREKLKRAFFQFVSEAAVLRNDKNDADMLSNIMFEIVDDGEFRAFLVDPMGEFNEWGGDLDEHTVFDYVASGKEVAEADRVIDRNPKNIPENEYNQIVQVTREAREKLAQ